MIGDWRRLALAALAAAGVAVACATHGQAQAPPKAAAKKAPPQNAEGESGDPDAAKKPAKKKQDPAEAQRAIEAAAKLLEIGKADQAAQSLTAVVVGGNLPPAIMARALLYRGIAYRQQKKPAQAIADLTSALWLKGGLGEADRKDALRQRASAYAEAGLSDGGGEPIAPAMPGAGTRTASATGISEGGSPSGAVQEAPKQSSGWSFSNPFAGLFGGSSQPAESAPPPPPPPTTSSISAGGQPPRAIASAWSQNTEVRSGGAQPAAPTTVASRPDGKFRIQVGMVRTQAEAQVLADRVRREHASVLAARDPDVDETVVGNMGSFYRVRFGPFATSQEGQAACAKLKGSGIDCLVVTQ